MSLDTPRIAVVTVLWKSAPFLPALLDSVAAVDWPRDDLELHFVENGPGDGSLDALERERARLGDRLPKIVVHQPGKNLGFAGGNNVALERALADGADYAYLLNHDATFEPQALRAAVDVARSAPQVGSVQSLLVLADAPETVNTRGNALHYLGFGYVGGLGTPRADVPDEVVDIAFSSGACVLLPAGVLREVGLFDEHLWLYHEDCDLGWRIRLRGYRNLLAPRSVCRHAYEFGRSPNKWLLLERNRWLVLAKNLALPTLIVLLPQLIAADLGLYAVAAKAGWLREKVGATRALLTPETWRYLWKARREVQVGRRVPDREILRHMTAVIDFPEVRSPAIERYVEPVWRALLAGTRRLVRW